jgi:CheY-like chemotaxis protein
MTASVMKADIELCFASGMSDLVCKPFHFKSIAEILSKWAKQRQTQQQTDHDIEPQQSAQTNE